MSAGCAPASSPKWCAAGRPSRSALAAQRWGSVLQAALVLAGNDQTCGAVGAGCREGTWLATLGTALVAYRLAGPAVGPYHPAGCWGPYPGGGYYELGVAITAALRSIGRASTCTPARGWKCSSRRLRKRLEMTRPARRSSSRNEMGAPGAWGGRDALRPELALSVLEGIGFSLRSAVCRPGSRGGLRMLWRPAVAAGMTSG